MVSFISELGKFLKMTRSKILVLRFVNEPSAGRFDAGDGEGRGMYDLELVLWIGNLR